jgi:MarR family 2-MHQ and catechol resistance regulon transcriptional repressor
MVDARNVHDVIISIWINCIVNYFSDLRREAMGSRRNSGVNRTFKVNFHLKRSKSMPTRHQGSERERLALDVFIKLSRATAGIGRAVHAPLREHNLTETQFGVLDTLHHAGPIPVSTLAEKNLCSQNSLSTVIDTMEKNGLVHRGRLKEDRRIVHVTLTERGQALYQHLWPAHLERIVEATAKLDPDELGQLNELLRKLGR